jgi:tetratricopeptide (TPR) repeat protein
MIIISYVDQSIMKISTKIKLEAPFKQKLSYLLNYAISVVLIIWLGSRINMVLSNYYYDLESNKLKSSLSGLDPKSYPEKAVDFILKNKVSSNMFNDFNSGAYLIGRAYPERRVFIDGRTEIYGDKFFHQYIDILNGDAVAFEKMVDSYQIGAILFNMISNPLPKIITYIHKDPRWQLVYLDDSAVVFLRDIPSNKELIKNYEIDLKKYSPPIVDLKILGLRRVYPSPYIKRANLFNVLEEDSLVIAEAKEALRMMPASSEAYHFLGKAYLRKKLYEEALEHLRSAILLSPGNAEMLVDLGVCLKELKENESAIHALQGAIKYSPRNALAYYQLGSVFLAIKDETKAIQALNKAIEYAPQNARCYLKLAEAFYEKGKRLKENTFLEKAREEANKALRLSEQDKELRKEIEDKLKEIVDKK